jgi:hypothetical protein
VSGHQHAAEEIAAAGGGARIEARGDARRQGQFFLELHQVDLSAPQHEAFGGQFAAGQGQFGHPP